MNRIENLPRRVKTCVDGVVYEFRIYVRSAGNLGIAYIRLSNHRERIISTAVAPAYPVREALGLFEISIVPTLEDAVEETFSKIDYLVNQGIIECLTT